MKPRILLSLLMLIALAGLTLATAQKPPVTDDSIIDNVRLKLAGDPVVKGGALDVSAKDGVVTLRGKVEVEKQKARASKLTKKVKGVKGVDNQLQVVGKGNR